MIVFINLDHWSSAAGGQALYLHQGELVVRCCLSGLDTQAFHQMCHDLFRIAEEAGNIRTDLDYISSYRLLEEHRIETCNLIDFVGGELKNLGDSADGVGRQITDLFLSKLERREER